MICPGFVRTPFVDRQIPDQARELGLTEDEVVKKVMLRETVDGEFTTVEDIAEVAVFFASFPLMALTGQSLRREPRLAYAVTRQGRPPGVAPEPLASGSPPSDGLHSSLKILLHIWIYIRNEPN